MLGKFLRICRSLYQINQNLSNKSNHHITTNQARETKFVFLGLHPRKYTKGLTVCGIKHSRGTFKHQIGTAPTMQ